MKYAEYKYLILSDLYRVSGSVKFIDLLRQIVFGVSYKYTFWMRTCRFTKYNLLLKYTVYPFARIILYHFTYKLGILIPFLTEIASGFYIGHFGGIIINSESVIGKNCNISHGVTLGQSSRGKNIGCPILGDNVYIGPGAKIVGAVKIGNNVAIGANCVVVKDIPDNSVVVGIPGKIISQEGSLGYVIRTDYDDKICKYINS
jgi:serine O-acetyltransferase